MKPSFKIRRNTVYTYLNSEGIPIYIGCSCNPFRRLEEKRQYDWFHEVAVITLAHFSNRDLGMKEEMAAIKLHRPKYNVLSNPDFPSIRQKKV